MFKKTINTLSSIEKKRLIILSLLTFLAIIIEIFGLALIIPIIKLLLDDNFFYSFLSSYSSFLKYENINKSSLIAYIMVIFFIVYMLKTLFLSLLSYAKFKFISNLSKNKTLNLLKSYFNKDILYHKNNHSSKLIKNLLREILLLETFWNATIILISESIFTLLILVAILIYDIQSFLIIVIYALIVFSIFRKIIRDRVLSWGIQRQNFHGEISKYFTESFGAIKELIIYNKREFFYKKIKEIQDKRTLVDIKYSTIRDIPKFLIELIALFGFFIISVSLYLRGDYKNDLLVTLIFFSALFFKALPSLSRINSSIQQIKFNFPALDLIHSDIHLLTIDDTPKNKLINFEKTIQIKNLAYKYPDTNQYIFKNFSYTINKGDKVLIIGKSGKGKTTFIDILAGFLNNYEGNILVDCKVLSNKHITNWRSKIGYLSQNFFMLDDSIKNNIIINDKFNEERFNKVISICGLVDVINSLKDGIESFIGEKGSLLSGGEKQRIGLARAVYRDPEILILDEPTSSLDEQTSNNFINSILNLEKKYTVLMISHKDKISRKFDKIIKL